MQSIKRKQDKCVKTEIDADKVVKEFHCEKDSVKTKPEKAEKHRKPKMPRTSKMKKYK